mgnify:CR=1 FL=1
MALTIPVAEIVESSRNPLLGKHESWGRVLLGDIATIQNGFPFKSSQFTRDEGMPLIRIRDVGADSSDTNYVGDYDPAFIVKAGDLLIGMDGDFNCARWRGPDGLLNQRVCRVILKSDIYHPKLLDYALPGYLGAINDMTSSVTVKHLSSKSIAEIPLPLPPMDQQKRIVAEIEKQFSRLDEAVANLKRVKANLKRYKAAVLKAAVEGRLVETEAELARREGRSYETGEQLLQRILEIRRSQWFISGRGQGKGKYKEPAEPNTTDLPELPEGWVWANVDQLSEVGTGATPKRDQARYYGGEIPWVTSAVVNDAFVDHADEFVTSDALAETNLTLYPPGTLLVAMYGEGKTRGKCSELRIAATTNQALAALQADEDVRKYLKQFLEFNYEQMRKVASGGVQPNLNLSLVRAVCVPLPPMAEQNRIVAEVDRRLTLLHETEAQVDANLQRAGRLRQSILQRAFSP